MPATLTPLRYPGGKTKYTDLFIDIITANHLENCTFVEVFAGGAGAAISLLLKGYVNSLLLNDLDIAIYSFWKSVKEYPDEFIKLVRNTRVSMAEWKRQKTIYERKDKSDALALGFATFYLNRCNRSGILGARPIGGMEQKGAYKINSRYNKITSINKINAIAKHANNIEIFNLDGVSFLKLIEKQYENQKYLLYLDPPYYQKGPALYLNHFRHDDHLALRDAILECTFPWVLSYDYNEKIVDMYHNSNCKLYQHQIRHTITGNTYAKELIISKLRLPDYLSELQRHDNRRRRWA
ncbi:MAG TPA: DNA adenine methylase [Bacteroidetes bacterium]|nr:DNA adenine methylase [Bacteroidota bacterium]HEX04758.1 DNA adenine methylase [Bacteroidota bacterium]